MSRLPSAPGSSTTSSPGHRRWDPPSGDPGLRPGHQGLPTGLAEGMVVYEIDQPQVIEFKTRTLADLDVAPTADRRPIGIDLRNDWPNALRQHGFDVNQPTAWIAEGLLVYLPPEAQDRLFDSITALSAPGSRVATEHFPDPTAFSGERAQQLSERWSRLGFDLNMSDLIFHGERSTVIQYLTDHGWDVTRSRPGNCTRTTGSNFRG